MKTFSKINENHTEPQTLQQAIAKVVKDTLNVEMSGAGAEDVKTRIVGTEELTSIIEKLVEVQNVKHTIRILESIKKTRNLDMNWINEAIENEKRKIE